MTSLDSLKNRLAKLERQSGVNQPIVLTVVHFVGSDGNGHLEDLTPEEVAVSEKYKEEMITAAKPGKRFIAVYRTKQKAQELLAQAGNDEQWDKLNN